MFSQKRTNKSTKIFQVIWGLLLNINWSVSSDDYLVHFFVPFTARSVLSSSTADRGIWPRGQEVPLEIYSSKKPRTNAAIFFFPVCFSASQITTPKFKEFHFDIQVWLRNLTSFSVFQTAIMTKKNNDLKISIKNLVIKLFS